MPNIDKRNYNYRHRAKKLGSKIDGTATNDALRKIGKAKECFYCGKPLTKDNMSFDHIMPLSRGGKHSKHNLIACCTSCNMHKNNLTVREFALLKDNSKKRKKHLKTVTKVWDISRKLLQNL